MYMYLYIPEPWFQFVDPVCAVLESKQSQVEGASRVETLVGRVVDVLSKEKISKTRDKGLLVAGKAS